MSGRIRRIVALALVVGLVAQASVAPAVAAPGGTEDDQSDTCSAVDTAVTAMHTLVSSENLRCQYWRTDSATKTDAYANALGLEDQTDAYYTTRNNMAQDVRGVMYMKGKMAAVEALNNGANESEAIKAWKNAVDDYTTRIVRNDLRAQEARVEQAAWIALMMGSTNTSTSYNAEMYASTGEATYNLPNGTTVNVSTPMVDSGGAYYWVLYSDIDSNYDSMNLTNLSWEHGTASTISGDHLLVAEEGAPDQAGYSSASDSYTAIAVNAKKGNTNVARFLDARNQIMADADTVVPNIYTEWKEGDIDLTDVLGPVTLAQEASTQYNSTGFHSFGAAELAALGIAGDTNVSHTVYTDLNRTKYVEADNGSRDVSTVNASIEGTIFLSGNSTDLQTGTTYDPSTLDGTVYMTVASVTNRTTGDSVNVSDRIIVIENNFTISEATNTRTGESVNVTNAEDKTYEDTNASRLKEKVDELRQERDNYEALLTSPSGSGTSGSGSGFFEDLFGGWLDTLAKGTVLGLVALAGAGLLMLRILAG